MKIETNRLTNVCFCLRVCCLLSSYVVFAAAVVVVAVSFFSFFSPFLFSFFAFLHHSPLLRAVL